MSGIKQQNGRRMVGTIAKAVAVALVSSGMAYAGAGNTKTTTSSSTPYPEPLNVAPNVHWFADWQVSSNPTPPDIFSTPFATSGNVPAVQADLSVSATSGKPLGIKVQNSLSDAAAASLFNTHYPNGKAISYVFADFEGSSSLDFGARVSNLARTKELVNQIRKPHNWSEHAYVGEFALTPLNSVGFGTKQDPTRRGPLEYTNSDYQSTGVNMANTDLYPGMPTYRNKSTFDWANQNIRTGLFVGPIGRMTAVQLAIGENNNAKSHSGGNINNQDIQVPWVSRFNNWGNTSLDNDPAPGFQFHPGAPLPQAGLSGAQTANQMMGRGDFSAQILHYRLRGAYSVALFEPGVVGYTKAQMQDDVRLGWYGGGSNPDPAIQHTNAIFAASDAKAATMTLNPVVDGSANTSGIRSENTGTIWSGEYSKNLKKLDILASNLDTVNHLIKFGSVDAYDVFTLRGTGAHANDTYSDSNLLSPSRNALIEFGMHRLLQFDLVTTKVYNNSNFTGSPQTKTIWLLNQNYLVFQNNNRNDTGIPEPTTFGIMAAAGSMAVVCRRQRRKDA